LIEILFYKSMTYWSRSKKQEPLYS